MISGIFKKEKAEHLVEIEAPAEASLQRRL